MKTKNLIAFAIFIFLFTLFSCSHSINGEDAKTLIKTKVPKCVNVAQSGASNDYAAVDSSYRIRFFYAHEGGVTEIK